MPEEESVKESKSSKILVVISIVVAVGLIVVGAYFYFQYKKTQDVLKNPTKAAQVETANLIKDVGRLIDLPKDEQPTIATVSDVTKLKGQPFFAKAQNGFKVLIYSKAQKAILYDPTEDKIIEVGPVNIGSSQNPTPEKSAPIKLALYNGTSTVGLTTAVEKQLRDKGLNIDVVEKANTSSSSAYTKTLVIDLSGKQAVFAKQIASILSGEVSKLPEGENKPKNVEVLVILGSK